MSGSTRCPVRSWPSGAPTAGRRRPAAGRAPWAVRRLSDGMASAKTSRHGRARQTRCHCLVCVVRSADTAAGLGEDEHARPGRHQVFQLALVLVAVVLAWTCCRAADSAPRRHAASQKRLVAVSPLRQVVLERLIEDAEPVFPGGSDHAGPTAHAGQLVVIMWPFPSLSPQTHTRYAPTAPSSGGVRDCCTSSDKPGLFMCLITLRMRPSSDPSIHPQTTHV